VKILIVGLVHVLNVVQIFVRSLTFVAHRVSLRMARSISSVVRGALWESYHP